MTPVTDKHVLIVQPADGALTALEPSLQAMGFDVDFVADVDDARAMVARTQLLSLVAIDGAIGELQGAELLRVIKDEHSDLPVVWVTTRSSPAPVSRAGHAPDVMLQHPVDIEQLREAVERLLCEHLYPHELRSHLSRACTDAMRNAYDVELALAGTNIRANRTAIGTVTAILPFVGPRVSGRLIVGSEPDQLAAIRARALPTRTPASQDELEDVAGEFANIVVGRIKAFFASQSLDLAVGTPVVVSGAGNTLSYRASRPTLLLTFSSEMGGVRVALCFDILSPENAPGTRSPERPAATGDLLFL